jgi:hypothetical protein
MPTTLPWRNALDQEHLLKQADVPQRRRLRYPCLIPHAAGHEKLPASRSQQPDERPHLCGALDIGELHHIPGNQVGDVRVMEPLPAPRAGPRYRFGEAAAHDPVGVLGPADLGRMPEVRAMREYRVNKPVWRLINLALRERPELDGLHPAGQRVRQATEPQHPGRSAEQVAARTSVVVYLNLDRQQQFGDPLDLVDDHHVLVVDESGWIRQCRLADYRRVQVSPFNGVGAGDLSEQGALPALPCAVDEHDARVLESLPDRRLRVPLKQPSDRRVSCRCHDPYNARSAVHVKDWTHAC